MLSSSLSLALSKTTSKRDRCSSSAAGLLFHNAIFSERDIESESWRSIVAMASSREKMDASCKTISLSQPVSPALYAPVSSDLPLMLVEKIHGV